MCGSGSKYISITVSTLERVESTILPSLYAILIYDFDLHASHARALLHAALASVPFEYVLFGPRGAGIIRLTGRQEIQGNPYYKERLIRHTGQSGHGIWVCFGSGPEGPELEG